MMVAHPSLSADPGRSIKLTVSASEAWYALGMIAAVILGTMVCFGGAVFVAANVI